MTLSSAMEWINGTVTEFIFLGFTNDPVLQILLFLILLLVYIITLLGNIGIIILIYIDSRLQTPMYFFLCHLSFIDICYSSVIAPKTLENILAEQKTILFIGCAVQMYFYAAYANVECLMLGVMAYDRYMAICSPLLYAVNMNKRFCIQLVVGAYMGGFINSLIHTSMAFHLTFCGPNLINHFYCDVPPVIKLSCSDTSVNELLLFIIVTLNCSVSFVTIIISYSYILSTIMRIRSTAGKLKAFNTCASHLTAVLIFFGTILFMYLRPKSSYSNHDKLAGVFYAVVIPMLNPMIYSLRNKEVKGAFNKAIHVFIR
ncbi:olfactory receptor 1009-like [Microcaecilia unicolor]|uniref:Olfactory receptor n=1 Tax=Microcaecilia unicolor TaxID=1415580 RepID=A0A6P7ZUH1_9AMPH|nr:olfactory receptor 1009-like [Microcaecilia unicolor]